MLECPICITDVEGKNFVTMNCNHGTCYECFDKYLSTTARQPCCCLCRTTVTKLKFTNTETCDKIKTKYIMN
jgi:hypothetical protein